MEDNNYSPDKLTVRYIYRSLLVMDLSKKFVENDNFVVMYGDNYFKPYEAINDVIAFHLRQKADVTLVLHPVHNPTRYGIVKINKKGRVLKMIEKPTIEEAKDFRINNIYLNIAGMLLFKNNVFLYIEKTPKGKDGEIWLTDTVELMRKDNEKIFGY